MSQDAKARGGRRCEFLVGHVGLPSVPCWSSFFPRFVRANSGGGATLAIGEVGVWAGSGAGRRMRLQSGRREMPNWRLRGANSSIGRQPNDSVFF